MIRRTLSLLALSSAFLSNPIQAQGDLSAAAEALSRGANEEALRILEGVLAQDLSNEAAYELWSATENRVWLQLLTRGGEVELLARELADKARLGRRERENNPDAVRELAKGLTSDDALARARVVHELAAKYGEFAVPVLVYSLGENVAPERRVNVIQALTRMGSDVVPPLVEALEAQDATLRRNVALTLGYVRDPRAVPMLAHAASQDSDAGVRNAAEQSLSRLEAGGDAGRLLLAQGDAYYAEDPRVLSPHQYSDVIWRWEEGQGLVSVEVPRFLYAPEMAKKAYYRALPLLPEAGPALAGIARCAVSEIGRLAEWQAAGQDVGEWAERLQTDDLAAQIAGPDALDTALGWAIQQGDMIAASGLCRLLADTGNEATTNLRGALAASASGAVQGEAAVALGSIAYRHRQAADAATVSALTTAATREILRIGAVIGGSEDMRAAVAELQELGYHTSWYPTGARGINAVRSLPGVDLIVVSGALTDITARNVVNELRTEPRFAKTPIWVKTSEADADPARFGDVAGLIGPDEGVASAAEAAASEPMNRDREEALALAARAAQTLHKLAAGGKTDVQAAAASLAGTLADRPDEVVVPALEVLRFVGGPPQIEGVAGVLANAERSEVVRVRAAEALAGIFSRSSTADAASVQMLQQVAQSDASFAVRAATAGALGQLDLGKDLRIQLMQGLFER